MEYLQLQCSDEQQHSVQAGGVSYLEAESVLPARKDTN